MKTGEKKLIEAVCKALEEERQALVSGRIEALPDLLVKRENLILNLKRISDENHTILANLSKIFIRNQRLLNEALRGVRIVSDRINSLSRIRNNLETYDKNGQVQSIKSRMASVERRA